VPKENATKRPVYHQADIKNDGKQFTRIKETNGGRGAWMVTKEKCARIVQNNMFYCMLLEGTQKMNKVSSSIIRKFSTNKWDKYLVLCQIVCFLWKI